VVRPYFLLWSLLATSRPPFRFDGMYLTVLKTLVLVFFVVMGFGTFALQSGPSAIVVIPIGGMLINSSLSSTAIAINNCLTYLSERKSDVETLLCLGATRLEATRDLLTRSVTMGLTPIVSLMNTAGIVSISGLMAGQLLAHAKPINAARNQIVLLFLITTSTAAACASATMLCILAIIDDCHRVRSERLLKREENGKGVNQLICRFWSELVATAAFCLERLNFLLGGERAEAQRSEYRNISQGI
jgi:putative ABC transport system permease protein